MKVYTGFVDIHFLREACYWGDSNTGSDHMLDGRGAPSFSLYFAALDAKLTWPTDTVYQSTVITYLAQVQKHLPKWLYPTTRCIIDTTEAYIQMPSNPTAQQLTFA